MKIYILSGGKSKRMGEDKGLKLLNGRPIISYLLHTLSSLDIPISIVTNNSKYEELNIRTILDLIPDKGPLGGIYTALSDAMDDVLVLSVDTPFISLSNIQKLIDAMKTDSINVAYHNDTIFPLFSIFPMKIKDDLYANILNDQLKVLRFLEEKGYNKINLELTALEILNINTIEEFDQAKKLLND